MGWLRASKLDALNWTDEILTENEMNIHGKLHGKCFGNHTMYLFWLSKDVSGFISEESICKFTKNNNSRTFLWCGKHLGYQIHWNGSWFINQINIYSLLWDVVLPRKHLFLISDFKNSPGRKKLYEGFVLF